MKKLNKLDEIVLLNHYTILEDIWKEAPDGFKAGVNFKQWMANQISTLREAIEQTLAENGHLADGEQCTLWRLKQAIGMK